MSASRLAHVLPAPELVFCATGKSGLGHLRRITNIASAMRRRRPDLRIALVSNAEASGLSFEERSGFCGLTVAPRVEISKAAAGLTMGPIVVDTAILPGLERANGPLCLILRETVPARLHDFRLPGDRAWDLVCIPNPGDHWLPSKDDIGAKRIEAVGWIFRSAPNAASDRPRGTSGAKRRVLVASGGGGTDETADWFKSEIDQVLSSARILCPALIDIVQAVGPRLPENAILDEADECIQAGSDLNQLFSQFDLVISTAGYNSVLELAGLDVPVLLVPIARGLDDQSARCTDWAPKLGNTHVDGNYIQSAHWVSDTLESRTRRAPVPLDPSGHIRCADLILGLVP
jgi:predicted glycosyltransferase